MHMAHPGQFGCEMRMYRVRCRRRRWVRGTGGPARQPVFAYARRIALMPIAMNPNLPMGSLLRLPIHAETHAGFGEVGGMLSFDGQDLLVEFQTRDSLLGLLKGRPQTLRVPLHTIARTAVTTPVIAAPMIAAKTHGKKNAGSFCDMSGSIDQRQPCARSTRAQPWWKGPSSSATSISSSDHSVHSPKSSRNASAANSQSGSRGPPPGRPA